MPSQMVGKRRKTDGISVLQSHNLPDIDPGAVVIHRWRERLCQKIAAPGENAGPNGSTDHV